MKKSIALLTALVFNIATYAAEQNASYMVSLSEPKLLQASLEPSTPTKKTRPRNKIEVCGKEWLKANNIREKALAKIKTRALNVLLRGQTDEVINAIKKARRRGLNRIYSKKIRMKKQIKKLIIKKVLWSHDPANNSKKYESQQGKQE